MQQRMIAALILIVSLLSMEATRGQELKTLPLPGESFKVGEHVAFVILPAEAKEHIPWVWYAPTLKGLPQSSEVWMFKQFLDKGIAIAGVDVGESFGNPAGRKAFSALHAHLVSERNFRKQPCLLARSRGGLMLLNWAVENPELVGGVAGIYPVCNLASYPGIAKAAPFYGMSAEQLQAELAKHNPVDRLEPLAKAGVPVFHIHGDVDKIVPLEDNSALLAKRYESFGGPVDVDVPPGQGHNMWQGFFQSQKLTDFAIDRALGKPLFTAVPTPIAHWKLDDDGEVAKDTVGGHDGKIVGAKIVQGKHGEAMDFVRKDGNHVAIPYSKDFEISNFTVSAWVYLTKAPTFSGILGTRHGGDHVFDMKVNADKVHGDIGNGKSWIHTGINFYKDDTGANGEGGDLELNRWYHITYVIDSVAQEARLYLNADLKKRIAFKGKPILMTSANEMRIGNSNGAEFMDGRIDEVKIWNQALSSAEVKTEMGSTQ